MSNTEWIYFFEEPVRHKGLIEIGRTGRTVEDRNRDKRSVDPWREIARYAVFDSEKAERKIIDLTSKYRYRKRKEILQIDWGTLEQIVRPVVTEHGDMEYRVNDAIRRSEELDQLWKDRYYKRGDFYPCREIEKQYDDQVAMFENNFGRARDEVNRLFTSSFLFWELPRSEEDEAKRKKDIQWHRKQMESSKDIAYEEYNSYMEPYMKYYQQKKDEIEARIRSDVMAGLTPQGLMTDEEIEIDRLKSQLRGSDHYPAGDDRESKLRRIDADKLIQQQVQKILKKKKKRSRHS